MTEAQQREFLKQQAQESFKKQETRTLVRKYNFPFEMIPLPSKGKYNPEIEDGMVKMKYMTAKEEDILSSANLIRQGKAIELLLNSLIISEEVQQENLLIGDRNALIIASRILGYGQHYPIKVTCPKCTHVNPKFSVDLNTFNHEEVELQDKDFFEVTLPQSNLKVAYRLLRVKDADEVDSRLKENPEEIDHRKSLTTASQILSITGDQDLHITDREEIEDFVLNHMFVNDFRHLRKHMVVNSPDVNQYIDYECPKCKEKSDLFIELGPDFFWPGV